jgi:hypothetical protein
MKVLSNCSLTKLREYAQSYGTQETIPVPFIKEFQNEIWLLNDCGEHTRTMRKGTKVLIDFTGTEITERQLKTRANKAIAARTNERLKAIEEQKQQEAINEAIAADQLTKWKVFLQENPDKKEYFKEKSKVLKSSKFRNYLRLKAARHINNESFENLQIDAYEIKEALYN